MTNTLLSQVALDKALAYNDENGFKFEDTVGFKSFGESAKIGTYEEWATFLHGSAPFLQMFAQKYARQYQITSVMQLLHGVSALMERARKEGNPQHVLVVSNHMSTCSDLIDMLGAMLNNPEQMEMFQRHPTFTPEHAEFNQLSAIIFVLTMSIRLLNNELVVVFQRLKNEASNANEAAS